MKYLGIVLLSISVVQITGCAWANRNGYHEPVSGDVGSVVIVNPAAPYRSNVWLYNNKGENGKALNAFDATPERTVKVMHADTIVLSLNLVLTSSSAVAYEAHTCKGAYAIPFSSGDLKVVLDVANDRCVFSFYQKDSTQSWRQLTDIQEWKTELCPSA